MSCERLSAFLFVVFVAGCSPKSHSQADADKAKEAVVAVLENWKSNEPIAKLKSRPEPIDFNEELRQQNTLNEFQIVKVDSSDPAVIRVVVSLKLKDKKGKLSDREATYSVALKKPIAVTRDPYF